MTLATELSLTMGHRDRYPVMEVNVPDSLYREVVLARLSALLDRPVLRDDTESFDLPAVEIADERYRSDIETMRRTQWLMLVAGSLYPTAQECGPGRTFPERAYKEANNRVPTALRDGAQRLSDDAAERIKADVIARLEATR